ncbi:hypothetical protein BDF19DRAFT_425699 [Syncephalis fuscata]|nr:hypothetical protein BDF19DRAFT_425699 [Syncephalis fuscata]
MNTQYSGGRSEDNSGDKDFYTETDCQVRTAKRVRLFPPPLREASPGTAGLSDCESHGSAASLRSLLDAVEFEHQRLSSASPPTMDSGGMSGVDSDWSALPSPVQSHSHTSMSIASLIHREEGKTAKTSTSTHCEQQQHYHTASKDESDSDEASLMDRLPAGWTCTKPMLEMDPLHRHYPVVQQHEKPYQAQIASNQISSTLSCEQPSLHRFSAEASALMVRESIKQMLMTSSNNIASATNSNSSNNGSISTSSSLSNTTGTAVMTRVTCWHAAVAQKSYGNEKRFLCPPPVVRVLRKFIGTNDGSLATKEPSSVNYGFYGPPTVVDKPQLSMTVMCESASRDLVQKSLLDENHMGSFKYLHVAGTEKAKQFYLKLKLHGRNSVPFATFDSSPISIISKPSKKTVKARNISTCIFDGSSVSLFSRINSQTVRTRYLDTEDGQLCAKNSGWSAFTIEIVRDGTTPIAPSYAGMAAAASAAAARLGAIPITYGSHIVLTDKSTGTSTGPLVIRKVERGQVVEDACGPVSQMQKIALEKINDAAPTSDSATSAIYLCAGYDANVVATSDLVELNQKMEVKSSPFLSFGRPRFTPESPDAWVDDHLCWTIVGLAKFEYIFCERTIAPSDDPISPCPELVGEPTVDLESHPPRLYLPVNNWYAHVQHRLQPPRELWLGQLGPLATQAVHPSHYSQYHRQETPSDLTLLK